MTTEEMDYVFGMPYMRVPHPAYGRRKSAEMIILGQYLYARLLAAARLLNHRA